MSNDIHQVLAGISASLDSMDASLDRIDERIDRLEKKLDGLTHDISRPWNTAA